MTGYLKPNNIMQSAQQMFEKLTKIARNNTWLLFAVMQKGAVFCFVFLSLQGWRFVCTCNAIRLQLHENIEHERACRAQLQISGNFLHRVCREQDRQA